MTIERSQGKPRIEPTRLRDASAPASAASTPTPDAKRPYRAPRRKLTRSLRARVVAQISQAMSGASGPETGAKAGSEIAAVALSLYRAGQRELGTSSPMALSHLLRWAVGTATAQHLSLAAADAGPATDRGRSLLELSMKLEGRAERASVAALTFARELAPDRAPAPNPLHARILGAGDGGDR